MGDIKLFNNKFMLMAIFIVSLLAISAVSANDLNETCDLIISDDVVGIKDEGTFSALQTKIEDASEGSIITLENDYAYNETAAFDECLSDGICIDKNLIINGNGHIIDASSKSRIFYITSDNVVLNNIQFVNGYSDGKGGAVYCYHNHKNISIVNCKFYSNNATRGGAIYADKSTSVIDCIFESNYASLDGGALYNGISINCTFNDNFAGSSGGAQLGGNSTNSIFTNNQAFGEYGYGGALNCAYATDCKFINNTASSEGGAICDGSSINCTFINNIAIKFGGAISRSNSINCTFINNLAGWYGGAIYRSDEIVENCIFINNSAPNGGACCDVSANKCTFIGNTATEYGAICLYDDDYQVKNCVFINNFAYLSDKNEFNHENCTFIVNISSPFKNNIHAVKGNKFSDIQKSIYHALPGDTIELSGNYIGSGNEIKIYNKPITISGKNATLDAKGLSDIFDISSDNVTLVNLKCIGAYPISGYYDDEPIHIDGNNVLIKECEFVNNNGYYSGAIFWRGNNGFLKDCTFINNVALKNKGTFVNGKFYYGVFDVDASLKCAGAIYWDDGDGIIENCNYNNNSGYYDDLLISNDANVEIREISTILDVGDVEKYYGGSEKLVIMLKNSKGEAISNADIKITLNNGDNTVITNNNGEANFNLNLAPGIYDVVSEYEDVQVTSKVKVLSTVSVGDVGMEYLNSKVSAAFLNTNGKALANTKVTFKVGDKTYSATTNANGVATVNVPLGVGNYQVTAINPINKEEKQFKLAISKASSQISLSSTQNNGVVTLTATLAPANATGNVAFNINGQNKNTAIKNGKATLPLNGLEAGSYEATASYNGDNNLNASTSNVATFTVEEVYPILTAHNLTKTYGSDNKFVVNLMDNKGNAIANVNVNVDINSQITPITTDSNGRATMPISLKPGDYTAIVTYENAQDTAKITVKKATPKITAKAKTFKKSDKTKKYTVTLKNNKKLISGATVKITVNKKTYTVKTKKGVATFKLKKLTKKGKYAATVKYMGSNCYNAAKSVKVKLTVK